MRSQELNLLMVFDAIMTEGSITRASEQLAMTQPAVSNAVSRMRSLWNDELFVKDGRNIQPTAYAKDLWSQISDPLSTLNQAITPGEFDPSTTNRTFRVSLTDVVVDIAWKPLRRLIEEQAPGINVYAIPYTAQKAQQVLDDADADLVIGQQSAMSSSVISEYLFTSELVCIMRTDHPLAQKETLDLATFAEADHLLVTLSGDTIGITDQAMALQGLRRRVAMTVNHFSSVVPLIKDSNLIAVVPSTTVEKPIFSGEIAVKPSPVNTPPNPISCYWHRRQERDKGLCWFRKHLNQILIDNAQAHMDTLHERCREMGMC